MGGHAQGGKGVDGVGLADAHGALEIDVADEACFRAQGDGALKDAEGADDDIISEGDLGVDDGRWMNCGHVEV